MTAHTSKTADFGGWPSQIDAAQLTAAAVSVSDLQISGDAVLWRESRPTEGGRQVIMQATQAALDTPVVRTPAGFNARTRVQEYGGTSYIQVGERLIFANFADQRLYLQRGDAAPVAITPVGFQFADFAYDALHDRIVAVREDHRAQTIEDHGEERTEIVALAMPDESSIAEDAGTVLVTGSDFYAYPRVSKTGQLAWISWNHPAMPWDRTKLEVAQLSAHGLHARQALIDLPNRAPTEPQWDSDGSLYVIDDPSGWWNLYRWDGKAFAAAYPREREFGGPLWQLGATSYALRGDGTAVVRSSLAGVDELGLLDLRSGSYQPWNLPYVAFSDLHLDASGQVIAIAASATDNPAIIAIAADGSSVRTLHQPSKSTLPSAAISAPKAIEFPTTAGADGSARTAFAWYYPPTNPDVTGPASALPPLLVTIHGGPTSVARPTLSLARQYWTSRGFALVDVNYGGSTSLGRAYRERLHGQWGVVDVADAVAAVDYLIAQGLVDSKRIAIRGGSAGGYTALAALAFTDRFNAGANLYGVSDIAALAATSHKFERHYDVSLVGPPSAALYRERSPIYHLENFTEPLITLQGADDKVVPPAQSRQIFAALKAKGTPTAYIEFAGEQHGFRQAANIIRAQEAELYFYGQMFGFVPADVIDPVTIENWPR